MGLDMYLTARVSENSVREVLARNTDIMEGLPDYNGYGTPSVNIPIYYWRKANAIHKWFVDNCADGVDNCQPVYVSFGSLQDLRATICDAINNNNGKLLPTESGCFFGSTDYDEYYWQELKDTKKFLDDILGNDKFLDWSFEYQASW